jgi:quercetin dioxygenase-like cupin family protein
MNMPEVQNTASMVEYQPNAIVSRTLLKKPKGNVTVFAFDKGEALSEHTTPHDALLWVVDGKAEVTISGTSHEVGNGTMIHLPANEPHAVVANEAFKMVLIMLQD